MPLRKFAKLKPSVKLVAVTGGAGFIGSHLCETLLDRGDFVVALDNLSTGRTGNLAHLLDDEHFLLLCHDITEKLPNYTPRFDEIYNLACPASPVHYQADRVSTALICAQGTYNCLERALRDGAKLFHASTSEVYGDPEMHPQREDYRGNVNPIGPRACYDEGKRFAETLITDFADQNGVPVKMARIFNTYGPRMQPDDGRVVSNFIVQAIQGNDITVYGDGSQTRSFCYVDDLVRGIVRLMESPDDVNTPVNLGNPDEYTVGQLADIIVRMTGSRSKIVYKALPEDDPTRRRPDISKARELLGWSPDIELEKGLRRTIAHFRNVLEDRRVPAIRMASPWAGDRVSVGAAASGAAA